jgi:DnaJ-class molecular chaperone
LGGLGLSVLLPRGSAPVPSGRFSGMSEWITRTKPCPACRGSGVKRYIRDGQSFEPERCPSCLGNGWVLEIIRAD